MSTSMFPQDTHGQDVQGPTAPSAVALVMAEALSLAVREVDRATAVRRLQSCSRDSQVLLAAAKRCRSFDQVEGPIVVRAATWLEAAVRRPRPVRERPAAGNLRQSGPRTA